VAAIASPLRTEQAVIVNELRSSDAPNLTEVVRSYMNFGAAPGSATNYNCTAWAQLFNTDGVRNTPGVPPSMGWEQLGKMCELVRSQFTMLWCDSMLEIDVRSYNAEKRTAFSWNINGVLASTGQQVTVPAITALFMDKDGTIQEAWDWLDPAPFGNAQPNSMEVVNMTEIVRVYMNFGGFPNYPHAANCSQWASLFGETGVLNYPGIPPFRGLDVLNKRCDHFRGEFETMLNFAEQIIPVTSWNAEKRVAVMWAIEGMMSTGEVIHKQVISTLFLWRNGTIQNSWDFLDSFEPGHY